MTCDPSDVISSTDLSNLKLDVATIDSVVESSLDTTTTKSGTTINTLRGQLKLLGYEPPVTYAGSIAFTVNDNVKTIDRSGVIYAPLPTELPFTTTGTWGGDDEDKFFVVQGLVDADLADYVTKTELAAAGGSGLAGRFDIISGLLGITPVDGATYEVVSYHDDLENGGGAFKYDASLAQTSHNGGTIIAKDSVFPALWSNQTQLAAWYDGPASGTGCYVRLGVAIYKTSDFGAIYDGVANNYLTLKAISESMTDYSTVDFDGSGTVLVSVPSGSVPDVADNDAIGIFRLRESRGVKFANSGSAKIRIEVDYSSGGSLAFLHAQGARDTMVDGLNIDYQASGGITLGAACRATLFHLHSSDTNPSSNNTIKNCILRLNHPDGPNFGFSEGADAGKLQGVYVYGEKTGGIADNFKFINNTFWDTTARVVWLWRTRNSVLHGNVFLQSGEYPCFRCLRGNENLSIQGNIFDMIQDGTFHSACIAIYAQGIDTTGHIVEGNIFYVANGKALELSEIEDSIISNNYIFRPSTALGDEREGITFDTGTGLVCNVTIDGNYSNRSFVIQGTSDNITVTNNTIEGKSIGYSGSPTAGTRLNHDISRNKVFGAGSITYNASSGKCNDNTIIDAEFHGIDMRATTTVEHIQIIGNTIDGFNTSATAGTAPNTFHGIHVASGDVDVKNNTIRATSVVANSYGIYAPSVGGDKAVICNNTLKDAATGDYGANTIVYNNVVGNALVP